MKLFGNNKKENIPDTRFIVSILEKSSVFHNRLFCIYNIGYNLRIVGHICDLIGKEKLKKIFNSRIFNYRT